MSVEKNYEKVIAEVLKSESFENELYRCTLDIAINRLESQKSDTSDEELLQYIQELFEVEKHDHLQAIKKAKQKSVSKNCMLKVLIEKAEHLASKDVDGSSDPYCLVAVVPTSQFANLKNGRIKFKQTKFIESSLNPDWNETIETPLTRDQIKNFCFQVQVWDYDGEVLAGSTKKVKGMKGMKRYVQEVAQSVASSKHDDQDDFMGFNSVPLVNIPADGLESWFKLRTAHSLQNVTGRIKLRISLTSVSENERKYGDDVIYAGLLRKIATKAHKQFARRLSGNLLETWNGSLPLPAKVLLRELEEQYRLPGLPAAIARWEVYAALHVQHPPGVDIVFMEGMLTDMEENRQHVRQFSKNMQFTVEMLCHSIKVFIQEECKKIAKHRDVFSSKRVNYIIHLGSVLLIFKKISKMGLYNMIRTLDPSIPSDVRINVIQALENGTGEYYYALYDKLLDESVDEIQEEEEEEEEVHVMEDGKTYGDPEVEILIRLTKTLQQDLLFGKAVYHDVFLKVLDIDYVRYVSEEVGKHLARDTNSTMTVLNKKIDTTESVTLLKDNKAALIFSLYMTVRNFIDTAKKKVEESKAKTTTMTPGSPKRIVDTLRKNSVGSEPQETVTLNDYQEWFRPNLLRWLKMSKGHMMNLLIRAVDVDKMNRVDSIVKHSSSAVDAIACFSGVVDSWNNLQWPDPVDSYTIALRITDDMASVISCYADLIYKKLKAVGFFDDDGQFDVTEELCVSLNNLWHVKLFLDSLPKKMEFEKIADAVDRHPEGPSGERVMANFSSMISSAEIGMNKKIHHVTGGVGNKMKPDIQRYLRHFAQKISQGPDLGYYKNRDEALQVKLDHKADEAIKPLMNYLENNIISLQEWLCKPNFRRILEVLWENTVDTMKKTALVDYSEQRPDFFYQCQRVYSDHFIEFFHAGGKGIPVDKIRKCKCSKNLEPELKMRHATSKDLMKIFYMQMYDEQQTAASNAVYGFLNVFATYHQSEERLQIDVISAEKLRPLDVNGLSDPFVQVNLGPIPPFPKQDPLQTSVEKKTLNPVWEDETFNFRLSLPLAREAGNFVIFTVLDHDVISANDLEGEAVLPLAMIEGIKPTTDSSFNQTSTGKNTRHFKLALTQPKKSPTLTRKRRQTWDENANGISVCHDDVDGVRTAFSNIVLDDGQLSYEDSMFVNPLSLLKKRTSFDVDASEFCKLRVKIEKAVESTFNGKI